MMKDQTGVMQTLPKKDLVDFNVAMTAERLMRNGIDPNALKNANQVENAINQIEAPRNVQQGIRNTESAKVFDMTGKKIDPRSKIMGGKQAETEEEILARINEENKKAVKSLKERKKPDVYTLDDYDTTNMSDIKKEIIRTETKLGNLNPTTPGFRERAKPLIDKIEELKKKLNDPEDFADGGVAGLLGERTGFKKGSSMTRRTFLKLLGGMATIPIIGKFLKPMKVGKTITKVPVIQTENVAGKPEWFDALVNKVIMEGDDVTKRFATGERQSIHQKTLDDGSVVRVTEDVDDGAVRVEYESDKNVFEDPVQLQYRKPLPDEGDPRPTAEFTTAESGPVGRRSGPDDFDIEVDEVGGTSIKDLDSDVSKLKEYATGKGPTMKELVQNIKRKDKAKAITEGGDEMIDAVARRQGDYDPFASGGIARMLGE
jgi:hypothetical protein